MTNYAHVIDGAVDQIGNPPRVVLLEDGWLDLRSLDPATLALAGWFPLVREPRPDDTETTTWDAVDTFDGSTVTYTWVERPKTQEELDADAAQEAAEERDLRDQAILEAVAATATPPEDGQAWVQPSGAHDAYPVGATVTHNGSDWVSLTPFNVWEPGFSGWREEVAEGYPVWVQPTGAHDAYQTGDRVAYDGQDWESTVDSNVYPPGVVPGQWVTI